MYLKIKVRPNSRKTEVVKKSDDSFDVSVRAKPIEGEANEAVLEALSEFLSIPRSRLRLVRGAKSRNKIVESLG
jgi:uncharacterized protein